MKFVVLMWQLKRNSQSINRRAATGTARPVSGAARGVRPAGCAGASWTSTRAPVAGLPRVPGRLAVDHQAVDPAQREDLEQGAPAELRESAITVSWRAWAIMARAISASSMEKSMAPSPFSAPTVITACSALNRAICSMARAPTFCSGFRAVLAADHECTVAGGAALPAINSELVITVRWLWRAQFAGEQRGGGAGVDEDAVTGPEQAGGVAGDCAFFLGVLVHSRLEGVLVLAAGRRPLRGIC